jgi:hypothetical protein
MFSTACALWGSPHSAFGRTTTSITAWWYVRMHVGTHGLYRFGPRECVIPYILWGVGCLIAPSLRITGGYGGEWKNSYRPNSRRDSVFDRGTSAAIYSWLEIYPFTNHEAYLTLSKSIFYCVSASDLLESSCFLPSYLSNILLFGCAWDTSSEHQQSFRDRCVQIAFLCHIFHDCFMFQASSSSVRFVLPRCSAIVRPAGRLIGGLSGSPWNISMLQGPMGYLSPTSSSSMRNGKLHLEVWWKRRSL